MVAVTASKLRAAALRKRCFSLAKNCSIGLRSGEYLGRKNSLAPGGPNGTSDGVPLVAAEIVHHDDVARFQGWDEDRLDIEAERTARR
jgi:hypothetical protein